jgi:hypothetical protein
MNRYIKYALVSVVLIILQTTLVHLLNLEGIIPDILAIWVIYIALMNGQMEGTLWGFSVGLVLDMTSPDFVGLSALAKTICGFLAGYFYNDARQLSVCPDSFLCDLYSEHHLFYHLHPRIRHWPAACHSSIRLNHGSLYIDCNSFSRFYFFKKALPVI